MYSNGVWPISRDLVKFLPVGLDQHASPSTLLLQKFGVAVQYAVKGTEFEKAAVVELMEKTGLSDEIHVVLAILILVGGTTNI